MKTRIFSSILAAILLTTGLSGCVNNEQGEVGGTEQSTSKVEENKDKDNEASNVTDVVENEFEDSILEAIGVPLEESQTSMFTLNLEGYANNSSKVKKITNEELLSNFEDYVTIIENTEKVDAEHQEEGYSNNYTIHLKGNMLLARYLKDTEDFVVNESATCEESIIKVYTKEVLSLDKLKQIYKDNIKDLTDKIKVSDNSLYNNDYIKYEIKNNEDIDMILTSSYNDIIDLVVVLTYTDENNCIKYGNIPVNYLQNGETRRIPLFNKDCVLIDVDFVLCKTYDIEDFNFNGHTILETKAFKSNSLEYCSSYEDKITSYHCLDFIIDYGNIKAVDSKAIIYHEDEYGLHIIEIKNLDGSRYQYISNVMYYGYVKDADIKYIIMTNPAKETKNVGYLSKFEVDTTDINNKEVKVEYEHIQGEYSTNPKILIIHKEESNEETCYFWLDERLNFIWSDNKDNKHTENITGTAILDYDDEKIISYIVVG